jgi:hypothetical protein
VHSQQSVRFAAFAKSLGDGASDRYAAFAGFWLMAIPATLVGRRTAVPSHRDGFFDDFREQNDETDRER